LDGRYVAFESSANNLVPGDFNGGSDVFVYDRQAGVTTRVSVDSNGLEGNAASWNPRLSGDGRFVAFVSKASNLSQADGNGNIRDVFVHDRQTGQTTMVSVDSNGVGGNSHSGINPSISADGRWVAFESSANNLALPFTSLGFGRTHVFVHDRQTGITKQISKDFQGSPGNDSSQNPVLSADGRYVAFDSEADNLITPGGFPGAFVFDQQTSQMTLASLSPTGIPLLGAFPGISGDGRWLVFQQGSILHLRDRVQNKTMQLSLPGGGRLPTISQDGRVISFISTDQFLVPGDTNVRTDVFIFDVGSGTVSPANKFDLNGDGRADLVWRNATNGGTMVWQMTAGGLRGPITFPGGVPVNWDLREVADVNGDGRADLVWRNATNGGTMVWQMTAGALRGPITFPGGVPTNWEIQ